MTSSKKSFFKLLMIFTSANCDHSNLISDWTVIPVAALLEGEVTLWTELARFHYTYLFNNGN